MWSDQDQIILICNYWNPQILWKDIALAIIYRSADLYISPSRMPWLADYVQFMYAIGHTTFQSLP